MLRETDFAKQRELMREFEKYVLDTQVHEIFLLMALSDRCVSELRQRLQDQPQPLRQSGFGDDLAR